MSSCAHPNVHCLNEHELIRKYRCEDCSAVMMCACDEKIGREHLPHQLGRAVEFETQQRIPVTAGFQTRICRECRRLPPIAHPKAESYGSASKIKRYYWRELAFKEMELLSDWLTSRGSDAPNPAEKKEARDRFEKEALDEIKRLHERLPKYSFREESQAEIIRKYGVEVIDLAAAYAANPPERGAAVLDGGGLCTIEEFASRYFRKLGYQTLFMESVPFHVLFGTFMWLLIQDAGDPRTKMVSFGDRLVYEARQPPKLISMIHPLDFGRAGYAQRRAEAIDEHFALIKNDRAELRWLFDYWLQPSAPLRQYLWAHREEDIARARQLIEILLPEAITRILRYLVGAYWDRYLGWPDLLVYRDAEFFFAEVKSSGDKLREAQKRWIADNHRHLKFAFKLIKVHKTSTVELSRTAI